MDSKLQEVMDSPASPEAGLLALETSRSVARCGHLFESLRGQTVFVSGGTGFFGKWLLETFSEANQRFDLGATMLVLSRSPERFREDHPALSLRQGVELLAGDVRTLSRDDLKRQLGRRFPRDVAHFIHAASETTVAANRDRADDVLETACVGTRRLLDLAEDLGAKRFLLTSSGAVYGGQPAAMERVPESYAGAPDIGAPMSAYGEGKRVAELLCNARSQAGRLDCRIARCFAFVGPHLALDAHYAIGNFIRDALAGSEIQVNGDGTPCRSYLYAGDLAAWLWTLLLDPRAHGTYNVGSGESVSIAEIASRVALVAGTDSPVVVARPADPALAPSRYVPDVSRARSELGLDAWTSLDEAIRKTLEFHHLKRRNNL